MTKTLYYFCFLLCLQSQFSVSQVTLDANGPGDTYELINSVLAPGYNVIEAPDCGHTTFNNGGSSNTSRHIDEVFDSSLNTNVFRFYIHVTPDNDRCTSATDRQRNEIKTYDQSPANLKGIEGETVVYKWKFKLAAGFQPSSSFTHIHQLKSVDGLYEDMPMYTLTTYKGSPDKLTLRYAQTNTQVTVKQTDLTPFKGNWVDVTETIKYGSSGTYSIVIKKVSDGTELFNYSNNSTVNWQTGASFVRPKWGIYRSLNSPTDLRDEEVLFSNFSIEEIPTLSTTNAELNKSKIRIIPNPTNNKIITLNTDPNSINSIYIYDNVGRFINSIKYETNTLDVSNLKNGIYFLVFKNNNTTISSEKLIIK